MRFPGLEEIGRATHRSLFGARLAVCGLLTAHLAATDFRAIGHLPVTAMHPPGMMEYLGWKFYDRLITPGGMLALQVALIGSLIAAACGYLSRLTVPMAAGLYILYQGILRSFGHFNHDEMAAVWILLILAMSPKDARVNRPGFAYGWPVFLMRAVIAWSYFTAGILKLRLGGPSYFTTDSLLTLMVSNSLGNVHDTQFKLAFWLADHRSLVLPGLYVVTAWEILMPIVLVWPRTRLPMLAMGVAFHFASMLAMNIVFWTELLMYTVFVDWDSVLKRLGRKLELPPERFPHANVTGIGKAGLGVLLWDGSCGYCERMVGRLRWFARKPLHAIPFQLVTDCLPPEVLAQCERQMHWVAPSGEVVGGSQALIEALAATGHPWLATLLESPPLRPFTWAGYRIATMFRRAGTCEIRKGPGGG
jgi:predicted DCC family thiol-disulfide oxidoreductase YuxK